MDRVEKAVEYYMRYFNCSQGVFAAYAVDMGFDEKLALMVATNFGGGARKGELCGAVAGALMVLGLKYGHSDSGDFASKTRAYEIAEAYMDRFIRENGSVVCRELLGLDLTDPNDREIIREKNLFRTKCPEMVRSAAQIHVHRHAVVLQPGDVLCRQRPVHIRAEEDAVLRHALRRTPAAQLSCIM